MSALIVDALNLAHWCRPPSLRVPVAALRGVRARGRSCQLVFDASTPYRLPDEERPAFEALARTEPDCLVVPSGESADIYILERARESGAAIVSRDRFRDHHKRFRAIIHDPTRLLSGWVEADAVHIPALELSEPLGN